jgi:uncharacterized protein YuzE
MALTNDCLTLQYDAESDVLYASLGLPEAALSYEVAEDVLLRYVPPSRRVVGITIIDFTRHYAVEEGGSLDERARAIIGELLAQFPEVPAFLEGENILPPEQGPLINPPLGLVSSPWVVEVTSQATGDFRGERSQHTLYIGFSTAIASPRFDVGVSGRQEDA